MTISLKDIQKSGGNKPPRMLLHGPAFVGKTSFFSGCIFNGERYEGAPNPILIPTEDGFNGVSIDHFPLADDLDMFYSMLDSVENEQHRYQTLIIDSADWLEKLIFDHVINTDKKKSASRAEPTMGTVHGGYGRGYDLALKYWRQILSQLDRINKNKSMFIGIICHSAIFTFNDPTNYKYDRYELKLYQDAKGKGARDLIVEWADVIGFASVPVVVEQISDGSKKYTRAEHDEDVTETQLYLKPNAAYVAGSRFPLPDQIPLHWDNFYKELKRGIQQIKSTQ